MHLSNNGSWNEVISIRVNKENIGTYLHVDADVLLEIKQSWSQG